MRTIGNILWFIFGGLLGGLAWVFAGCIWCITIIGIPVGLPTCKFCQFCGISNEILTRFIFRKQSIYIKVLEIQFHHVIEWRRSFIQCFPPYVGILQNPIVNLLYYNFRFS